MFVWTSSTVPSITGECLNVLLLPCITAGIYQTLQLEKLIINLSKMPPPPPSLSTASENKPLTLPKHENTSWGSSRIHCEKWWDRGGAWKLQRTFNLLPQFDSFPPIALIFCSAVLFQAERLDNFGCSPPIWSPSSHFGAFSPSVPQTHPCSRPFYFDKIFNTLGMENMKKIHQGLLCIF